jgi:hypothetical protein
MNLTFSSEVLWAHVNTSMTGSSVFTAAAPIPQSYTFAGLNSVSLHFQARRNF